MSEFYKDLFQKTVAKGKKVARAFKKLMFKFCQSEHLAPIFERLPAKQLQTDLYEYLTLLVHSHRHNLEERINDTSIDESFECSFGGDDLSLVRDVMYKYSKKAMENFLAIPELCFLFVYFGSHSSTQEFILSKVGNKGAEYVARMFREIIEIDRAALLSLHNLKTEEFEINNDGEP